MEKYKGIIITLIIISGLFAYTYFFEKEEYGLIPEDKLTIQDKYDILKEEYDTLEEKYEDMLNNYEYFKKNNEYNKDLIQILQEQLLSYGINPEEL